MREHTLTAGENLANSYQMILSLLERVKNMTTFKERKQQLAEHLIMICELLENCK